MTFGGDENEDGKVTGKNKTNGVGSVAPRKATGAEWEAKACPARTARRYTRSLIQRRDGVQSLLVLFHLLKLQAPCLITKLLRFETSDQPPREPANHSGTQFQKARDSLAVDHRVDLSFPRHISDEYNDGEREGWNVEFE